MSDFPPMQGTKMTILDLLKQPKEQSTPPEKASSFRISPCEKCGSGTFWSPTSIGPLKCYDCEPPSSPRRVKRASVIVLDEYGENPRLEAIIAAGRPVSLLAAGSGIVKGEPGREYTLQEEWDRRPLPFPPSLLTRRLCSAEYDHHTP
jgi:hypothetical protein